MAEDLLHAPQVGAALQEMGGGRMPEPVRPGVGHSGHRGQTGMYDPPRGPGIEPAAPTPGRTDSGTRPPSRRWVAAAYRQAHPRA